MKQEFVIINGRAYSPITGMPIEGVNVSSPKPDTIQPKKQVSSQVRQGASVNAMHKSHTQRSTTLNRRHAKAPSPRPLAARTKTAAKTIETSQHISVNHFSKKPVSTPKQAVKITANSIDRPAQSHPLIHRATAQQTNVSSPIKKRQERAKIVTSQAPIHQRNQKAELKPAKDLKNEAIEKALAKEFAPEKPRRQKKSRSRFGRWMSFASAGVAVMLLGGYFTYLSMPNVSVRVAAVQSGIDAKYPGYSPNGYSLSGPIAFKDGEVTMKFAYVDSDLQYTLTQQESTWDSSAVKEHLVEKTGNSPTTTTVDGLTLYTSGSETTWVNGGILYQINGDAILSGEQIRKIATSM